MYFTSQNWLYAINQCLLTATKIRKLLPRIYPDIGIIAEADTGLILIRCWVGGVEPILNVNL